MPPLRILFDGWAFARQPASPAALHQWALLSACPPEVLPVIALPAPAPAWLPADWEVAVQPQPDTAAGELWWEQRVFPALRRKLKADAAHAVSPAAPLFGPAAGWYSPAGFPADLAGQGFAARVRGALARGGGARSAAGARAFTGEDRSRSAAPCPGGMLWPAGLPLPEEWRAARPFPLFVHPDFSPEAPLLPAGLALPEQFVLCHGPQDPASLRRALQAWTWPSGAFGTDLPLAFLGLAPAARRFVQAYAAALEVAHAVVILPPAAPPAVPGIYRRAAAVFLPGEDSPWGGTAAHALAARKPLVSVETPFLAAAAGPAAYLRPAADTRQLGAALIGAVVREEVRARLAEDARERSAGWLVSPGAAYAELWGI